MGDDSGWIWYWDMEMLKDDKEKKCPKCGSDEIKEDYDYMLKCRRCGFKWKPT